MSHLQFTTSEAVLVLIPTLAINLSLPLSVQGISKLLSPSYASLYIHCTLPISLNLNPTSLYCFMYSSLLFPPIYTCPSPSLHLLPSSVPIRTLYFTMFAPINSSLCPSPSSSPAFYICAALLSLRVLTLSLSSTSLYLSCSRPLTHLPLYYSRAPSVSPLPSSLYLPCTLPFSVNLLSISVLHSLTFVISPPPLFYPLIYICPDLLPRSFPLLSVSLSR